MTLVINHDTTSVIWCGKGFWKADCLPKRKLGRPTGGKPKPKSKQAGAVKIFAMLCSKILSIYLKTSRPGCNF